MFTHFNRFALCALALALLAGCSRAPEQVQVFLPRIEEPAGPAAAERRAALCSPERMSFRFLEQGTERFHHTAEFRQFFDCANYDGKYASLAPFIHNPASPAFVDALVDSMRVLATNPNAQNIREHLEPWFREDPATRQSRIDRILPVMADIIRNPIFQRGLPLLGDIAAEGRDVWATVLPGISRLVYDPSQPDLWQQLRKLFNVKRGLNSEDHLALTTREFFQFLEKQNPAPSGTERSNARTILELMRELDEFRAVPHGILSLIEYMNNRDIFSTLYLEAGGAIRGETVLRGLNDANGDSDEAIERTRAEKAASLLLSQNSPAPILGLAKVVREFNKPRPQFLSAIANWFSRPDTQTSLHRDLVAFVARRIVTDILREFRMAQHLEAFLRQGRGGQVRQQIIPPGASEAREDVCTRRINCEVTPEYFREYVRDALVSDDFSAALSGHIQQRAIARFTDTNAQMLLASGELVQKQITLLRAQETLDLAENSFRASLAPGRERAPLRQAINAFAAAYFADSGSNGNGNGNGNGNSNGAAASATPVVRLASRLTPSVDLWLEEMRKSWAESIVVHEIFRVISLFLSEMVERDRNGDASATIAQTFFRATYADPSLMERLVYEGKRSGVLLNLTAKLRWAKEDLGPQIFEENPEDREAFNLLVDQIPAFITYVESGSLRYGNNVTRALSERDRGWLINTYVDLISEAYDRGWIERFLPVWRDFNSFMDLRENRAKAAATAFRAQLSAEQLAAEEWDESRRLSDAVDALKQVLGMLFRARRPMDWNSSLGGEILVGLRPLVSPERIVATEEFFLVLASRTIRGTNQEIEAVWNFFSEHGDRYATMTREEITNDRSSRRDLADLIKHPAFPTVLIELDRLFKDRTVEPTLEFLAEKIESGELPRFLELARRLLGIRAQSATR